MAESLSPDAVEALTFERVSTSSRVADALRQQLLSGAITPGTPLRDVELSKRAGVARSTMREALAELVRDGLVQHSLHRGVEVAVLSAVDLHDIYAFRRVAERGGLEALRAARNPDFSATESALEAMRAAARSGDGVGTVAADAAFHLSLVSAAGSDRLTAATRSVFLELRLAWAFVDRGDGDTVVAQHEQLLDALRTGTRPAALKALDTHLTEAETQVSGGLAALARS